MRRLDRLPPFTTYQPALGEGPSANVGVTTLTTPDFDYHATRREVRDAVSHIGKAVTTAEAERRMSAAQLRRRRAANIMTDEKWQYRSLADGSVIVEIAYGYFLKRPLFGLTVFCVGPLAADAENWDLSLSGAFSDVAELTDRLRTLNDGGRERIAALAAQA